MNAFMGRRMRGSGALSTGVRCGPCPSDTSPSPGGHSKDSGHDEYALMRAAICALSPLQKNLRCASDKWTSLSSSTTSTTSTTSSFTTSSSSSLRFFFFLRRRLRVLLHTRGGATVLFCGSFTFYHFPLLLFTRSLLPFVLIFLDYNDRHDGAVLFYHFQSSSSLMMTMGSSDGAEVSSVSTGGAALCGGPLPFFIRAIRCAKYSCMIRDELKTRISFQKQHFEYDANPKGFSSLPYNM
ncbi:hypothetical protein EYF80_007099 [Liparis tanakae]|uniref:Uncharacterized protein n=1 Tax=Liparis tanakae TaxID=230148 RepID=A0A4Z2IXU5_9TELE|nr:hypothetical protein EYF80_007099 [Liparis tanakae]